MPELRRAMTTPWKIWICFLSPSRIRLWTSTVSPISKLNVLLKAFVFNSLDQLVNHRLLFLPTCVI